MSYHVVVTREDDSWLAEVPELEGTQTWARSLAGLDHAVREIVVLGADLPDEAMADLDLDYEFRTGDSLIDEQAASVRAERARAKELQGRVTGDTEELVKRLAAQGYSMRDISVIAGVAFQRVSQLLREAS